VRHRVPSRFNWTLCRLRLNCDGTRAETRFRLSAKRTSPFKPAGASVQSTTGSRGVRISGSNAGCTMFRGKVKSTGYPLHSTVSPSLPLPCAPVRHSVPSCFNWTLRRLRLKCDGTRAETRFRLSAKWTSPFKPAGASDQSTTGSRGVRISGSNAGYTMFRGSVKSTGYPLHSPVCPSLPLPCVMVCHHISTGLYQPKWRKTQEGMNLKQYVACASKVVF